MRFPNLKVLILLTIGLVILCQLITYGQIEFGGGISFNTYSMSKFNEEIVASLDTMISDLNEYLSGIDGLNSSLETPSPIRSGFSKYVEGRFWLLDFLGVGFEIEQLSCSSISSGSISVQTGEATADTINIDLGVKIEAIGFSGQTLLKFPVGPVNLLTKAVVGYYPTTLTFFASGSVVPSETGLFELEGLSAPDRVTLSGNAVYHGSGIGFKGLFGFELPLNSFNFGINFGFRFLKVNMGDLTGDDKADFLDFTGIVFGAEAGIKLQ